MSAPRELRKHLARLMEERMQWRVSPERIQVDNDVDGWATFDAGWRGEFSTHASSDRLHYYGPKCEGGMWEWSEIVHDRDRVGLERQWAREYPEPPEKVRP